jgi:archaemetzincin
MKFLPCCRRQRTGIFAGSSKVDAVAMSSRIRIVPINAIETKFLDRLGLCLEERFLSTVRVDRALVVSRSALNATRQQLFATTLTSKVVRAHPDTDRVLLAITDFDLYKTSHRFIFGDADDAQAFAAVSLHRLRSEFYGEEADANLLFQRTLKESVHELGHAFGLKHCYNMRCAMYYSNSIFETDNKMSHFCEACDRRITRARNERS